MPTTVKNHHQVSVAQHDKILFLSHITVGCKLVSLPSKMCQASRLLPFHNTGISKTCPLWQPQRKTVWPRTGYIFTAGFKRIHYFCLQPISQNPVTWP